MFIPLRDDNALKSIRYQYVTISLIAVNVLVNIFEVSGLDERIDATMETLIFRSITELLSNVRAHACATSVVVQLERAENVLHVRVVDDGRGFELDTALARARRTNHLGLESLMERVDASGGTVEIITAPGKGTVVEIIQPLWPEG